MPVKSLDASEKLAVVSERDENLGVVANGLLEDGKRTLADLVLLQLPDLALVQFGLWDVDVLTVRARETGCRQKSRARSVHLIAMNACAASKPFAQASCFLDILKTHLMDARVLSEAVPSGSER